MTSLHPLRPEPHPEDCSSSDDEPDLEPEAGDEDWHMWAIEARYVDYLEREIA